MTGESTLNICQAEICRLLSKALSDDVFKNPTRVTKVEIEEHYGTEHFSITIKEIEEVEEVEDITVTGTQSRLVEEFPAHDLG